MWARAAAGSAVISRGTRSASGAAAARASARRARGASSRSSPSRCRASNSIRAMPGAPGGDARAGDLEGLGAAVLAQRDRLAVQHEPARRQAAGRGGDLGQPGGEVVEGAAEDGHVVAVAVHLDPGAVELPVDRPLAHLPHGLLQRGRGRGEHGRERPPDLEPERLQAGRALAQRDLGHGARVAAQHRRPVDRRARDPGRPGDGVGHHARERPLAQLAADQGRAGTPARRPSPGRRGPPAPPAAPPATRAPTGRRCARGRRPRPRPAAPAAAAGGGRSRSEAQPTPVRRWRGSPLR